MQASFTSITYLSICLFIYLCAFQISIVFHVMQRLMLYLMDYAYIMKERYAMIEITELAVSFLPLREYMYC